jgi:hypothetical protein
MTLELENRAKRFVITFRITPSTSIPEKGMKKLDLVKVAGLFFVLGLCGMILFHVHLDHKRVT